MRDVNDVTRAAQIALFALADAAGETSPVSSAVSSSQANYLIADDAGIPSVTHAAARYCTGAVPRALTRAVGLLAGRPFPPRVTYTKTSSLAQPMAAAVVKLLTRHHLTAQKPRKPQAAICSIVCSPHLLLSVGMSTVRR